MNATRQSLIELAEQPLVEEEIPVVETLVQQWVRENQVKPGKTRVKNEIIYWHFYEWCKGEEIKPLTYRAFFIALCRQFRAQRKKYAYLLDAKTFDISATGYFKARALLESILPNRLNPNNAKGRKKIKRKNEEKSS